MTLNNNYIIDISFQKLKIYEEINFLKFKLNNLSNFYFKNID
jgi:hypothetical protein